MGKMAATGKKMRPSNQRGVGKEGKKKKMSSFDSLGSEKGSKFLENLNTAPSGVLGDYSGRNHPLYHQASDNQWK